MLFIAGKGHETYQEIKGSKIHYDERQFVQNLLQEPMIPCDLQTLAKVTHARLKGENLTIENISTHSKSTSSHTLFVALIGEKHDAHDFVSDAIQHGACCRSCESRNAY